MQALVEATRKAVREAGVPGRDVAAIALDTTGSSVVPVGEGLAPLDDYYLWCDHRAKSEAAEITATAHREKLEAIEWCGGVYSSEWGFSKLLHWLRHNPERRARMVTALEHCDMVAAMLCGISDAAQAPRSICAMGHKWMWNASLGGLPPEDFLTEGGPAVRRRSRETRRVLFHVGARSPARSRRSGRKSSGCAPAFRSRSARSTRIGTRSGRASARATSSTWSAHRPASWPSPSRWTWCRACAAS